MLARGHLPYFHVYGRIMFAPYNGIPRCSGRCLHRPAPQAGARPSGPMTSIGPYSKDVEEFRPRRGQSGKREKSVKKNAALLHFLGFFPLTLLFGVPRGGVPPLGGVRCLATARLFRFLFGHKKEGLKTVCCYIERGTAWWSLLKAAIKATPHNSRLTA